MARDAVDGSAGAPAEIGPFTILETIATRAFVVTYRAEQRSLGRTVRLKALKPTVPAASPYAAAIEREASVLARLDHEAIPHLYDLLRTKDSLVLVLEDVRGVPLADVVKAGRVEALAAAAIALGLARALGHAHERGAIHRGLRPSLVLLTRAGGVKIEDFGSASRVDAPAESSPEPLEAGETFARPDYMAPEQILGEPLGPRADVWALGVILHELVAGARPFDDGGSPGKPGSAPKPPFDAEDRRALAQRIRSEPPAPLPEGVPRAIERVIARCLAKAPEDRYDDARAAAAALEEAIAERTRLPPAVLVTRALAAARLGEALPAPSGAAAPGVVAPATGPSILPAVRSLLAVFGLIVAGGAVIQLVKDPDAGPAASGVAESGPSLAPSRDRGLLRVVARPWAEVYVDGELVDTTPIGRAIPLAPGKHFVTFRHPHAADEQRTIKIAAGQTVFLDVTLRVERPDAGARDAAPEAGGSP